MPIYDYRCDHCGHVFSAVQSYTDATLEKCPSCGKRPRKLMATPAIVFKGGGWYKTDSRAKPKDGDAAVSPVKDAKDTTDTKQPKDTSKETKDAKDGRSERALAKADAPTPPAPKTEAPSS